MELLERLYEIAEKNLTAGPPDWPQFAADFETVFDARMTLYRTDPATKSLDLLDPSEIITTNSPPTMAHYFDDKIFETHDLVDYPTSQFEPMRRTDRIDDSTLKQLPFYHSFLSPNRVFYLMAVHAVLPDHAFLVQFIWRKEGQDDFSDMEKMRMALFMRLLAKIVGELKLGAPAKPAVDVEAFGIKYALTDAETAILGALLEGQSLRQIAEQTGRSYGTIRWHVHNLLEKCDVKTQKNLLHEFYRLIKH